MRRDEAWVVASRGLPDADQQRALRFDLPPAEWQHIQRLHRPDDRLRSLTGRALARRLLARRLSTSPARVALTTGAQGKPMLRDPAATWHFNIAHSGDQVLVAVAPFPLGVDVECCPPHAEVDAGLWESVTGRRPQGPVHAPAFCAEWVRREAVLKACGTGLALDPARLRLQHATGGWQAVDGIPQAVGLRVRLLWQSPAHCAALCLTPSLAAWRLAKVTLADWTDEAPRAW